MPDTHSVRIEDENIEELKQWSHADNTSEALRYAVNQVTGLGYRMESMGMTAMLFLCGAVILDKISFSPWVGYVLFAMGSIFMIGHYLELLLVVQSGARDN
jgi:hypothetical protein